MIYEIKKDPKWLVREERKIYEARGDGKLARKRKRFRVVDVFAGAGGMTLGFSKMFGHAFDSVWANDFNQFAVNTYNANFGEHCVCGDIVDILKGRFSAVPDDLVETLSALDDDRRLRESIMVAVQCQDLEAFRVHLRADGE